ncbi:MAG: DsbA family protein [Steroidobacteraceae bacterium]
MNDRSHRDLTQPVNATDHVLGDAHAPVTVVEYGDFECPICKQSAPAVKLLLQRFENVVRVAYRHFPQESVHPHALQAAEAAECAGAQGRFWAMHDLLFENQSHLSVKNLHAYAQQLSLDIALFTAEMDDGVYRQRIREHLESGKASKVRATPGFFVDGVITDVSFGMRALFDAVESRVVRR